MNEELENWKEAKENEYGTGENSIAIGKNDVFKKNEESDRPT